MKFINRYLRNLKPYSLASHKIWDVSRQDRQAILKLDWNEATVSPSPRVQEKMLEVLNNSNIFHLYPCTLNGELLQCLSEYLAIPERNLQYFCGSDSLHEYIAKMYISVGDTVLILGPSYDNFRLTCESCGANVRYSMYGEGFKFSEVQIEVDINLVKPALVYICNPNNPTGNVQSLGSIEYLVRKYADTLFVIDEAYAEFAGLSVKFLAIKYENILISRTMSKAFGLANFRVGYLIASEDNIKMISRIRNPKNLSTFAQIAAIAALNDVSYMEKYVNEVIGARSKFITEISLLLNDITIYSGGGNFVLVDVGRLARREKICQFLRDRNVFVRELNHSECLITCFRITIGTWIQMKQVLEVLREFKCQHEK